MFGYFGNLPLHPLVIHAVVVGIPLTLLLAVLYAVPRTRSWSRWAFGLAVLGTTAATFVAKESGEVLERATLAESSDNPAAALIVEHARLADQLFTIMVILAVAGLLAVFLGAGAQLGRTGRRQPTARGSGLVRVVLHVLVVGLAVLALIWMVRVGDLGARAVWNPTNQVPGQQ